MPRAKEPPRYGSRRGGVMKYHTRVRLGITKPIAGEVIREARTALLAVTGRAFARVQAAFSLLRGTFMQHCIRQREGTYVDIDIDSSDEESDEEKANHDGDDNGNEHNNNSNNPIDKVTPHSNDDNNNATGKSCIDKDNETVNCILQAVGQLDGFENINKKSLVSVAEKITELARAMKSNDKQTVNKLVSIGARRTALYRTYATKWSYDISNRKCEPQSMQSRPASSAVKSMSSCDSRGGARNQSRSTSMSISSSSSGDSDSMPLPSEFINSKRMSESTSDSHLKRLLSRFGDNDRLSLLHSNVTSSEYESARPISIHHPARKRRRTSTPRLDPAISAWRGWDNLRAQQLEELRRALPNCHENEAGDLIDIHGTAWHAVRHISPHFFTFTSYYPENQPVLARALAAAFPDGLSQASQAPFVSFAKLGGDTLRLSPDEQMQAFECVVSKRDDDLVSPNDSERLEATWMLFKHACISVTRAQNCVEIVTNLLDDSLAPSQDNAGNGPRSSQSEKLVGFRRNANNGRAVLSRLASESSHTTCKRCPLLNIDEAKALRQFARGYL